MFMKKVNFPKISIVIPVRNMEKYIGRTIESIIKQKYPNTQLFIQDGASTDNTVKIIKKYATKYPRIIKWNSRKDRGQFEALKRGFAKVNGDIFTFINGDDYYEKGAFNTVAKCWRDNPNTLWLIGRSRVVNEKGKEYAKWVTWYKNLLLKINKYSCLLIVNYVMQPSVFFSKNGYKKYGPINGDKVHISEFDLWYKLGKVTMPKVVDEYLSCYSLFPGTGSTIGPVMNTIFMDDYNTTKKYTNNSIIIFLRLMHNWARVIVYKLLYNHK